MSAKVLPVVKVTTQMFVTRHDPETRRVRQDLYYEALLSCEHYEYRRFSPRHDPTALACAACTGRELTSNERRIRALEGEK